jgi:hypothetical protein
MLTTTNNRARVHPAQPRYVVVVQRRSFREAKSINGAVNTHVGMPKTFHKGIAGGRPS